MSGLLMEHLKRVTDLSEERGNRIAALEAQNKKLVEALATLEAISINAIEHVALANYPEREKKAIAQVEAYFSRARQAAQ